MEITPSNTPLKRYELQCPKCDEYSIVFPSNDPDQPRCSECDDEIDLGSLEEFILSWSDYLRDRAALLAKEREEYEKRNNKET